MHEDFETCLWQRPQHFNNNAILGAIRTINKQTKISLKNKKFLLLLAFTNKVFWHWQILWRPKKICKEKRSKFVVASLFFSSNMVMDPSLLPCSVFLFMKSGGGDRVLFRYPYSISPKKRQSLAEANSNGINESRRYGSIFDRRNFHSDLSLMMVQKYFQQRFCKSTTQW